MAKILTAWEILEFNKKKKEKEFESIWELSNDWIDDLERKGYNKLKRIGSTLEKKTDKKRLEKQTNLQKEIDDLNMIAFEESGLLDNQLRKNQFENRGTFKGW
jgi:hypothetical protein